MNFLDYIISQSIEEIQKLDNAMDRIKEIKMSNWNGKVKCVKSNRIDIFTKDKIYEVINGCIKDNIGTVWNNRGLTYSNLSEFHGINSCTVQFEEVKFPVLCEVLGIEPNEKVELFENNHRLDNLYWVDYSGNFRCDSKFNEFPAHIVVDILKGDYTIRKLPQYKFTENEITILSALFLNDYAYIARDADGGLWGYKKYPKQLETMYDYSDEDDDYNCLADIKDEFFQQVQWGNVLDIKVELDKIN